MVARHKEGQLVLTRDFEKEAGRGTLKVKIEPNLFVGPYIIIKAWVPGPVYHLLAIGDGGGHKPITRNEIHVKEYNDEKYPGKGRTQVDIAKATLQEDDTTQQNQEEDEESYRVERITNHRWRQDASGLEFQIKFKGYQDLGWEDMTNLQCVHLVQEYYKSLANEEEKEAILYNKSNRK